MNSEALNSGFTGLAVFDPEKKKMLYRFNSDKHFIPASNVKLLTYYISQKILGESVPALVYGVRNDSLIFSGTGDPSFLNPDLPSSPAYDFLQKRPEKLFYSPPVYSEEKFGPGWAWDDYPYSFSAERSGFPIYSNQVEITIRANEKNVQVIPKFFKHSLEEIESKALKIKRRGKSNIFEYSTADDIKEVRRRLPFITSNELLVKLISDTIQREVKLLPRKLRFNLTENLPGIHTDSLYKKMLQDSDNFIAEQLLLLVSSKISDSLKTSIAIDFSKKAFLNDLPQDLVWVDGSGLSRYNLTTPENMVVVLQKIKDEVEEEKLFNLLPAGGHSGTLKNQFLGEEPFIFAKTGSMSNNYSLSGFLKTESGRILIFSFMNSNFTEPMAVIKDRVEKVLKMIRDNY